MPVTISKAIVVGASSGIGAAIARRLAREGASVAILARRAGELSRLAEERPDRLHPYVHDVTRFDSIPILFERIQAEVGPVDTLVYAAGITVPLGAGEYNFEKERLTVETNLLGAMAWVNVCAAHFEAARSGTIVGISSVAGERGRKGNPAYHASKAGLTTYLESVRNRCTRSGVNVVTVKPGLVDTPMIQNLERKPFVVSADEAARQILSLARKGGSRSGYIPRRWGLAATIVRAVPSSVFRRL